MRKRFAFDINKAIATAWDVLWASNLRQRAEAEKQGSSRWASRTYYICAADVERLVRDFAEDTRDGKPWRTEPGYGGYGSGIRFHGNLQGDVRNWLFRNPKLTYHNFGRGHISGARFRPVGEPIGPSEVETIKKKIRNKDRPKLEHFAKSYGGHPQCVVEARKQKGQRIYGWRPSKAWTTTKVEDVTCPRCKKILAAGFGCEEIKEIA